jgi:Ca-activated chloride channel family protein
MTWLVQPLPPQDLRRPTDDDAGFGTLTTARGNLPLDDLSVRASVTGLVAGVEVTQGFRNPLDQPLEATYVFPLPDRAAVTGMRMEAAGHTVVAELKERAQARADYDTAIAAGQRASIAEEERPDVFTMRVGNILPGERIVVRLNLVQPLPYADGEAEFRFPLVVAPRYVPGSPLPGAPVGTGWAPDTDAVPDASRITPPVLLPGLPNPVPLSIEVDVDPAGLDLQGIRSSLHAVVEGPTTGRSCGGGHAAESRQGRRIRIQPGERADRDFVLRLRYAPVQATATAATRGDGTVRLTLLPPVEASPPRPRDVVLLLDRSGSMAGWKMVAARRAAARIVDTLTDADRFTVLGFDDRVETPPHLPGGLVEATDRNRYRAVEHLARLDARGGTEILEPLLAAIRLLDPAGGEAGERADSRDRVVVLVTDGQVGNEDQILRQVLAGLAALRVHVVGIDEAVNAGFLARLAVVGGGRCELVESEDRLDDATERIHRRISAPLLTGIRVHADGLDEATISPRRLPALFPGVPLVVGARLARPADPQPGAPTAEPTTGPTTGPTAGPTTGPTAGPAAVTVSGRYPDGRAWTASVPVTGVGGPAARALTATWARAHLRDLEDAYAAEPEQPEALEQRIVRTSLQFGVLCRFTAFVAVDERVVTDGGAPHRVTQPVEPARGWDMLAGPGAGMAPGGAVRHPMLSALAAAPLAAGPVAAPVSLAGAGGAALAGRERARSGQPPASGRPGAAFGERLASAAAQLRIRRTASFRSEPGLVGGPGGPGNPDLGSDLVDEILADVRDRLAIEVRRLRSTGPVADVERAGLLADLGTRLAVLVADLRQAGVGDDVVAPLRSLIAELARCESAVPPPAVLQALWQRTVDVLEPLADTPTPGTPTPDTPTPDTPTPSTPTPGTPTPGTPAPGAPTPGTPAPGTPATDRRNTFWRAAGGAERF